MTSLTLNNIIFSSVNYNPACIINEPLGSRTHIVTELKLIISNFQFLLIYFKSENYFVKNCKSLISVKNCCKITSLIVFLIVPVHWDWLNIGFKCREPTSFMATSEPLLLILSKSWSLKRYLSVGSKLTLNQSTQRLYSGVKLLLLNTWLWPYHM